MNYLTNHSPGQAETVSLQMLHFSVAICFACKEQEIHNFERKSTIFKQQTAERLMSTFIHTNTYPSNNSYTYNSIFV